MTIYALSTAPGRAGIAVIRISGKTVREALHVLCQRRIPAPRVAGLRALRHPQTPEILDKGLVLWFPGPASFTGEDMAELHLHGGRAVIASMLTALSSLGLRLAEPGEFTKRAFENGKLDLTEVEGLADLIDAETAAQRRQALAQTSGLLRGRYEAWRASLLRAMAYVEASLDFSDEADIAETAFNEALPEARSLIAEFESALADGHRGEILREGIHVAIVGAPNVGKSSLLNALAGREAAIVFDEPGTTRDVIEATLDLDGFPFVVRDTAGLRETAIAVEQEGIRRALATAKDADVILYMYDASEMQKADYSLIGERPPHPVLLPKGRRDAPSPLGERVGVRGDSSTPTIVILNKVDIAPPALSNKSKQPDRTLLYISAKTGQGLDVLKAELISLAREMYAGGEPALITRARHRQEIQRARDALACFLESADSSDRTEIAAENLREAADALGRLTGRLDVEDVLGQIFSEFCIGK
jgi:tRNA modification GTPase